MNAVDDATTVKTTDPNLPRPDIEAKYQLGAWLGGPMKAVTDCFGLLSVLSEGLESKKSGGTLYQEQGRKLDAMGKGLVNFIKGIPPFIDNFDPKETVQKIHTHFTKKLEEIEKLKKIAPFTAGAEAMTSEQAALLTFVTGGTMFFGAKWLGKGKTGTGRPLLPSKPESKPIALEPYALPEGEITKRLASPEGKIATELTLPEEAGTKMLALPPGIKALRAMKKAAHKKAVALKKAEALSNKKTPSTPKQLKDIGLVVKDDAKTIIENVVIYDPKYDKVVFSGTVDVGPTLDRIKKRIRHKHPNDGVWYKNWNKKLPEHPDQPDYYREYIVLTPGSKKANLQRLVIGKNNEIYYSPQHFENFVKVQ